MEQINIEQVEQESDLEFNQVHVSDEGERDNLSPLLTWTCECDKCGGDKTFILEVEQEHYYHRRLKMGEIVYYNDGPKQVYMTSFIAAYLKRI